MSIYTYYIDTCEEELGYGKKKLAFLWLINNESLNKCSDIYALLFVNIFYMKASNL